MRFGFQHLAPRAGHVSTLLRFEHGGQTDCVLVDAGAGVDLDDRLGDDEYLAATLLTHAHIDHYRSLGKNLRHQSPVYASPGTATALEHALTEATKDNDVGDVDGVLDALEPIDDWTTLVGGPGVEVAPLPAGHTVGAAGFLLRFEEEEADGPQHVLVSGDFTQRPCAGYPGLPTDLPCEVDAAFVNAATNEGFEETLTAAVEAVLERALAGGRVVVATGGLPGVHLAYLLGHAAADLDRRLPVRVVGQPAKLYDSLGYDVPNVEAVPVFDQTAEVLDEGTVTVAGPETPRTGSTRRLLGAIRDDPSALFAQVTTSGSDGVTGTTCASRLFALGNHPSSGTLESAVEALDPENLVVKHTRDVEQFRDRFPSSFVWASAESTQYDLYRDGEWLRPPWMSGHGIRQIEMARYGGSGVTIPGAADGDFATPPLSRREPDLAAEGLDVERLRNAFAVDLSVAAPSTSAPAGNGTGVEDDGEPDPAPPDDDALSEIRDRLDAIERRLPADGTVDARVLRGDDGVTLLQLLDDRDLPDGARVRLALEVLDGEQEPVDDGGESDDEESTAETDDDESASEEEWSAEARAFEK